MPQPDKKIIILLVSSFLIYFWLNSLLEVPDWDALSYIMNGKSFAGEQKYYEWHRPIIWPLFLGINFLIFGFNELIPRILGPLLSTLALFAIYKLGSELYNKKVGLYSSLIFFLIPLIIYWAPRMYTAIPCIGLMAASSYFLVKYTKNSNPRNMVLFGVFSSLSFLMRYTGVGILVVGIIYLIYKNKLNRDLLKALLAFLIVASPFFYFNWVNTGSPVYSMSIANNQMAEFTPTRLDYYVKNALIIFTPLALFALIALLDALKLVKNRRTEVVIKKDDGLVMSLLLFGFFLLYFQAWLNLKSTRYIVPVLLGFSLLCGKGFEITVNWLKDKSGFFSYIPHLLFVTGVIIIILIAPLSFNSCNQYITVGEYLNTLGEGNVVSPAWPYYNYYSDKTVKWAPGTYEELIEETQIFGIKYVVLTDWVSEPDWAVSSYFSDKTEFTKLQEFTGCLGTVSVYEYNGEVSGELDQRKADVINSNAFIPLKFLP